MTSSLKRPSLSKPKKGIRIDTYSLETVRARNRNKAHSFMLELFAQSGLSKADLAKMLGKKPEQITRWLAGPGNMNFDTLSDLVFALNGSYVIVNAKEPQSTVAKVGDKFGKRQSFENEKVLRSETKWLRASPTRSAASKNIIYLNMRKTEPSYERIPERTAS